ncbi:hypothetical protein [Zunongwangia pacifica]|uniref:Uncharacterized protein n=1 Tax=Zunongwangia pacifica TaxID=2911062 RepID=A0A9X1ZUA3_9FLAO|nr:hypothetical protein [Zunongwangia pacifica]MCL6217868.1 hypothetical protein [Zunongwangia pacifica]
MQFPKEEEFQKQRLLKSKLDKLRSQFKEASSWLKTKEKLEIVVSKNLD